MVILLERSKQVVEGAGAASVAALLAGKIAVPTDGEVCAVLSGGNGLLFLNFLECVLFSWAIFQSFFEISPCSDRYNIQLFLRSSFYVIL